MTVAAFVARWKASTLSERSAYQQHFLDLCALVDHPTPAAIDPHGDTFAFEKAVKTLAGGKGFVDAWKRDAFILEYKGKGKSLSDAYQQARRYTDYLDNPPLIATCDLERFEIHTVFTSYPKHLYRFTLDELLAGEPTAECARPPLQVLRALFHDPFALRPGATTAAITEAAAAAFGDLARSLTARGHEPHTVAHYLIRLLFCLFAEDVGLLPAGLFTRLATNFQDAPDRFLRGVQQLFGAMATGGEFGTDAIKHFNGGLFDDASALPLTGPELATLAKAASLDWANVEPSIFGTLFERSLDPGKRSQLGAHYTSRQDIERIVGPVVMAPLRRRWSQIRVQGEDLVAEREGLKAGLGPNLTPQDRRTLQGRIERKSGELERLLSGFAQELAQVKVLDPACGSGNFLYVALRSLLDLERAVVLFAADAGLNLFSQQVGPEQMRGLELSDYAAELAPVTVWIGYIQWLRENGFGQPEEPILRRFDLIRQQDAILAPDGSEPTWPESDFIVGNPPFLGDKKMRAELGDEYTDRLRALYAGRVDGGADLVTYWFEKSRALIERGELKRAGLITTNGIRFGANRACLERIKATGDLFMAWQDQPWFLDGAAVRVSMVGFDDGSETERTLDGAPVAVLNADLTSGSADVTTALPLPENDGLVFLGMMKAGPFDVEEAEARAMLAQGGNPNGRPNSDVVRRRLGAQSITGRDRGGYVIDFADMAEGDASLYEAPFEYVRRVVKPVRDANRDQLMRQNWWLFGRSRPALRGALVGKDRCIVTPEVAKHRVFVWVPTTTVPDHSCHVFARADDYFFGVLHSRLHEVWSLALGNRMGVGNDPRYNSSKTFGTFPMPWPPGSEPTEDASPVVKAVADAARKLVELRGNWLNPTNVDASELKKRTLTNLYNARPAWLESAHKALDAAVCAAYAEATGEAWPVGMEESEILEKLLRLNHQRAGR